MREPYLTARLQGFGTTIFAQMTALATRHDAVNLGQGFPDDDGPAVVLNTAVQAIRDGHNQYAPGTGVPVLRRAVADHQKRWWGLDYDADDEITVTAGATEALAAAILALCDVGDEVVTFEPTYDSYLANIAMAGAAPRTVTLTAPGLDFDAAALDRAITPRTRLVLLNSPHNPSGKVFSEDELALIADRCVAHDLVAVSDEVYEHLVYDGTHRPLATFPGMRERTVVISSAAKTFSVTGWKIGWICAPPALTRAVRTAKQFLTYTNGTPFQHGVAAGLGLDDGFFAHLAAGYRDRRDRLCSGLADVGFDVRPPAGTYFVTVDVRDVGEEDGLAFCRRLPAEVGVAAVPEVVFFSSDVDHGRPLVRFAFCKTDAVLDEGIRRLQALRRPGRTP
jgi:N-succinyldiaminopimelate aminotransferase